MKFQRWIQKNANLIMWSSAGWIILAFIGRLTKLSVLDTSAMILASIFGFVPIALHAFQALKVKTISIDLLVSLAVVGAFIIGEYDESAIVTFLFAFGGFLEKWTLSKTRSSIKALTQIAPTTAILADGTKIDIDEVEIGDELLVKTGAQIPVDGQVLKGEAYVNEASITGESLEVQKIAGDKVYAGSLLENGTLYIQAEKVGEDTTFGKIIELVEEAQDTQSAAEKFIDRFAKYYTPAVLVLAIIVFLFSHNFSLAITILVLGCPGALVIGVPVSNVAGIGNGAKHGVLIKGGEVMNQFAKVDTLLFDKTGTLTKGQAEVIATKTYDASYQAQLLQKVAKLERKSNHPLAAALVRFIEQKASDKAVSDQFELEQVKVVKGQGLISGDLLIGNEKLLTDHHILLTETQKQDLEEIQAQGASTVLVAKEKQVKLIFGIADEIRPEVKIMLEKLRQKGIKHMMMLTGDNVLTAKIIAHQLNIDEVRAELLPEEKAAVVQELKEKGRKIAFIGDGINDAPSLALADIGIAMGSGTDVAVETSDIVLMKSSFEELVHAYGLVKKTVNNMRQNILIAVSVVFFLLLGLILGGVTMASGMFVHEASILVVILNAMRLLKFQIR